MMVEPLKLSFSDHSDEADIRKLLNDEVMDGEIGLSLRRDPDYFVGTKVEGDRHRLINARTPDTSKLVGFGGRSVRLRYLNGKPVMVGYLGQFRLSKGYRARLGSIAQAYRMLSTERRQDEARFDFTTIMDGNDSAKKFLTAGYKNFPKYHSVGHVEVLNVLSKKLVNKEQFNIYETTVGSIDDAAEIINCLQRNNLRYSLAPYWDDEQINSSTRTQSLSFEDFIVVKKEGKVIGCLARWDQSDFKQVVVNNYSGLLRMSRPIINCLMGLRGGAYMPQPGCAINMCHISHVAVDDDDSDVFMSMFSKAVKVNDRKMITLGFQRGHLFVDCIKSNYVTVPSNSELYLVSYEEIDQSVIDDVKKSFHPEVALL